MNSVLIGVLLMLGLSLARVNVIVAMTISALSAGLISGLGLGDTLQAFNSGLSGGAEIALSYAMLGAFAVAISKSGLTLILADKLLSKVDKAHSKHMQTLSMLIMTIILACAIASQNLVPVHIAFIPILIPPLLVVFNKLQLDRRAIACILTFGLATSYMILPYGFGGIYLYSILHKNLAENGLEIVNTDVPEAMIIPALGMLVGLIIAVFFSYRKDRNYSDKESEKSSTKINVENPKKVMIIGGIAVHIFKQSLNLPRPPAALEAGSFNLIGPALKNESFPSGHAFTALSCATLIALNTLRPALIFFVMIMGVLAALSRVMVGAHWPVDILTGGGAGIAIAIFCVYLESHFKAFQAHGWKFASVILLTLATVALAFHEDRYPDTQALGVITSVTALVIAIRQFWLPFIRLLRPSV